MATMASLLARAASSASAASRASRAAALASARAARSAAAARRAAAAVSLAARSSTDAAAADLTLDSSREARSFRCDVSMNGRRLLGGSGGAAPPVPSGNASHIDSCLFPDYKAPTPVQHKAKFVADEKDLESDEALWALYERWCKHFNQERDRDEMTRRFDEFKRMVLLVHEKNNSDRPYKLAINQFTDGKLAEVYGFGRKNAFHQVEYAAKFPKTGSSFVWLDGKYYMELPKECQPEY